MKQHLPKLIIGAVVLAALIFTARLYSDQATQGWYGYVEGEYVLMGLPVGGNLETLDVRRGDTVQEGDRLFSLEATAEEAGVAEAEARLAQAVSSRDNLLKGLRDSEIDALLAQKEQAAAELELAAITFERQGTLFDKGHVSKQRVDEAQAAYEAALGKTEELEAQLVTAKLPARVDEVNAANAAIDQARAALSAAQYRLEKRHAVAPKEAMVFETFYRVGEFVPSAKPVLSLLPEDNVKIRFFIPERQLSAITYGQEITVACDGCGEGVKARVTYISPDAEFTPPVIYSETARQKLVFMVEAYPLDPKGFPLKPGQPVEIEH